MAPELAVSAAGACAADGEAGEDAAAAPVRGPSLCLCPWIVQRKIGGHGQAGRQQQANAPRQQPAGRSLLGRRFGQAQGKDPLAERFRRLADNARVRVAVAVELACKMRFRSVVRMADAHASLCCAPCRSTSSTFPIMTENRPFG